MREARDYRLTDNDVEEMVKQKLKMGKAPVNIAAQKAKLMTLRETFKDEDEAEYQRLTDEISKLDEAAKLQKERSTEHSSGVVCMIYICFLPQIYVRIATITRLLGYFEFHIIYLMRAL